MRMATTTHSTRSTGPLGLRATDPNFRPPSSRYCIPKGMQGPLFGKPFCPTRVWGPIFKDWVPRGGAIITGDKSYETLVGNLLHVGSRSRRAAATVRNDGVFIVNSASVSISVGNSSATIATPGGGIEQSIIFGSPVNGDPDAQFVVSTGYVTTPSAHAGGAPVVVDGNGNLIFNPNSSNQASLSAFSHEPAGRGIIPTGVIGVTLFLEYDFAQLIVVDENGHTKNVGDIYIDVGDTGPNWVSVHDQATLGGFLAGIPGSWWHVPPSMVS